MYGVVRATNATVQSQEIVRQNLAPRHTVTVRYRMGPFGRIFPPLFLRVSNFEPCKGTSQRAKLIRPRHLTQTSVIGLRHAHKIWSVTNLRNGKSEPRCSGPRLSAETSGHHGFATVNLYPDIKRAAVSAVALLSLTGLETFQSAMAVEISSSTTEQVSTSSANNGQADDVTITDDGDISADTEDGFVAVTVDSSNDVTNDGTIEIEDSDSSTGILIHSGVTSTITNTGSIQLIEDYTREDEDDDDDDDGELAVGSDRVGILLDAGGVLTGDIILESGSSITVEGNNSAAILLNSAIDGNFTHDGTVSVTGSDTTGILFGDDISGDIQLSGSVSVRGENALGVSIEGDVGGALTVESSILATGFVSTTATNYVAPFYVDEDTDPVDERLDADDLYDSGSALAIGGSLANGLLINGAYDDFVSDEDDDDDTKDTIEDFDENRTTGSVATYGSSPALLISPDWGDEADGDLTIGTVVETVRDTTDDDDDDDTTETLAVFSYENGLINRGGITANGKNIGFDATALRISGSEDGLYQTIISGGILSTGSISATTYEADSVAVDLLSGAVIGSLANSGSISAYSATLNDNSAIAISIGEGVGLSELTNSGSITSTVLGYSGQATAVLDISGQLETLTNSGTISASVTDDGREDTGLGTAVAIDLSSHAASDGVIITQYQETPVEDINDDDEIDEDDVTTPSIIGDIFMGAGDDTLRILAGSVTGDTDFAAGAGTLELSSSEYTGDILFSGSSSTVSLSNSTLTGDLDFGSSGGTFALRNSSEFLGELSATTGVLAVSVSDSSLKLTSDTTAQIESLTVSDSSTLEFEIDAQSGKTSAYLDVVGVASLGSNTLIVPRLTTISDATFSTLLIVADELSFEEGSDSVSTADLPWIYDVTLTTEDSDRDSLSLEFSLKTTDELGFDSNQSAAYASVIEVFADGEDLAAAVTGISDEATFLQSYNLILPQRTDASTRYLESQSTAAYSALSERLALIRRDRARAGSVWIQQHYSTLNVDPTSDSPGYDGRGLGVTVGADGNLFGLDAVGLMFSLSNGQFEEMTGGYNPVDMTSHGFGAYVSHKLGPFDLQLAAQHALIDFASYREVAIGTDDPLDTADDDEDGYYYSEVSAGWSGSSDSASALVSTNFRKGVFSVTPKLGIDYFSLKQDGYTETGTNGLNLAVSSARTDKVTAVAGLAFGVNWQTHPRDLYSMSQAVSDDAGMSYYTTDWTLGLETGARSTLSSTPYAVSANFVGYDSTFTLASTETFGDAATVGLALSGSSALMDFRVGVGTEFSEEAQAYTANASFRLKF